MMIMSPEPIRAEHITQHFDCGYTVLDAWLQHRALSNHQRGAGRVFVCADDQKRVVGYYALAAGEITHLDNPGVMQCHMPAPIPVVILGRFAVDRQAQAKPLGRGLLRDALLRASFAVENIGIRGMIVHALYDQSKAFFMRYGFRESPINPLTLVMRL